MPKHDLSYLIDILQAARLIETFVAGTTLANFEVDSMRQSAVARQIEIIGEATKRLSTDFRDKHPDIP